MFLAQQIANSTPDPQQKKNIGEAAHEVNKAVANLQQNKKNNASPAVLKADADNVKKATGRLARETGHGAGDSDIPHEALDNAARYGRGVKDNMFK